MKKNVRTIVYVMILVVVAGGIYLWIQNGSGEDLLGGLDPDSYDVEATCSGVEDHNLICNAGNDTYLYLDDVDVFLQKIDTTVDEKGDETTKVSYKQYSIEDLQKKTEEGDLSIRMWLTTTGKVQSIIVLEQSYDNNNASLANLDGLEPSSFTSSNTILSMKKNSMRLAPINYNADEPEKFEGFIKEYKLAKNVKFYSETVKITVDSENKEINKNIQFAKTTYKKIKDNLEYGNNAYILFNKYGNISAVMIFTESRVRDLEE